MNFFAMRFEHCAHRLAKAGWPTPPRTLFTIQPMIARILLHVSVAIVKPSTWRWQLSGIIREFL